MIDPLTAMTIFVVILIIVLLNLADRLAKVEKGVRWILEHVRIVTPAQEDLGYANIRRLFGIKDDEDDLKN